MITEFLIFKPYAVRLICGVTTRVLGSFNDQEKEFKDQLKKLPTRKAPAFSHQLHGDKIIIVDKPPAKPFKGDAFITNKKDVPLAVKVADCQGIVIFDPKTNTIAAVHSGWRGSALNIIGKTVNKMRSVHKSDPSDLLVGISPSLGPCCAEFTDPAKELPESVRPFINGNHVDLWALSLHQLIEAGVRKEHIEMIKECTKCGTDKYFSHRNKDTGRMAVFISLK